jgi:ATP-binding cassette subfamily B protein
MRESWRAVAFLVRTAWRADPWRSAGLLLEPVGHLRFPLFAAFLGMVVDGALRGDARRVALGGAGIAAVRVAAFVGLWCGSWIRIRLTEEVGFELDRRIAALSAGLPGVEHHERADYQDRLELLRQQQGVLGGALNTLIYTANTVVAGVGTLAVLAWVSPWLLLLVPFALPALPVAALQQRWLRDAEARSATPARRARKLQGLTVDRAAGMELRLFGLVPEILARMGRSWHESRAPLLAARMRGAVLESAAELLFLAALGGAVVLMLWRAGRGEATAGEVVTALYLGQQVIPSVVEPVRNVAGLGEVVRAAGRLLWLQDYADEQGRACPGARPAPARLERAIVFDNVSFRYPGTGRYALRDVSFTLPAGTVVALVGENGAGKTTLVKLLCRMYEPTSGCIRIDGVDLAEIGIDAWRARLTAAFQDFARLELTAGQAVGAGDLPRMDDDGAALQALDRAGGTGVLQALPGGLGTQLGARWEGGVDLSTGQWQRLALGRALMRRDPLVAVFDEPTASLDAYAEHALFERYAREARAGAGRGSITVLVSHRFSTVRSADVILVVGGGGILEMGGHDELLRLGGLYAELYGIQARAYAPQADEPARAELV